MSIVLTDIICDVVDYALAPHRVIKSAAGIHHSSRYLQIKVIDSDGTEGIAEAATHHIWSGETAETGKLMVDQLFTPLLNGVSLSHPSDALRIMDDICHGNPFAKSGIETAVWDAGYCGISRSLLVVYNENGIKISKDARIMQLVFMKLSKETEGYEGIYQAENS